MKTVGEGEATADYADIRFPATHDGNFGVYGVADQTVCAGSRRSGVIVRADRGSCGRRLYPSGCWRNRT